MALQDTHDIFRLNLGIMYIDLALGIACRINILTFLDKLKKQNKKIKVDFYINLSWRICLFFIWNIVMSYNQVVRFSSLNMLFLKIVVKINNIYLFADNFIYRLRHACKLHFNIMIAYIIIRPYLHKTNIWINKFLCRQNLKYIQKKSCADINKKKQQKTQHCFINGSCQNIYVILLMQFISH
jgi:hypothetical protein